IALANVNTIEFSMMLQSWVNGDTPPTPEDMPITDGEVVKIASMWGTLPGSTSVIVTSHRENMSRKHVIKLDQFAAVALYAGTATFELTSVDLFVRESLL